MNMRVSALLLGFLTAVPAVGQTLQQGVLPDAVQRVYTAFKVSPHQVGIYVAEVGAEQPLLNINGAASLNPASTIKLLTTWLGLEALGPAWTWPTEVYIDGEIDQGVLHGDLIFKGYGDPYFVTERLWSLQRQLRLLGINTIDGDLVIDNGYFASEYSDPGAFDGEALRVYNVFPDATLINFQAVKLYFQPDPEGNVVNVTVDPLPANLTIENRLKLKQGHCGGYHNGVALQAEGERARDRLILSGDYGQECELYSLTRSVLTGPTHAYGVFRTLWEEAGGTLTGKLRVDAHALSDRLEEAEPFLRVESPPLSAVIRYINKHSNNVMSRHLFLTLGAEMYGVPATRANARRAAGVLLHERGLNFPELRLDNGAGLSRDTRISAASLGSVLMHAEQSVWMPEFISSLSLAGLDGTLRKQFKSEDATGRMHLKTGRLDDVYATAGYVHARSGREYIVVILQNFPDADDGPGEEAQSALLRWVFEQ